MFSRLFKKTKHPSTSWGSPIQSLPEYNITDRNLGSLQLSDELTKAHFLGKPETITEIDKDYYNLLYPELGLVIEFERDKLTYIAFIIGNDPLEPKSKNLNYCSPVLVDASGKRHQWNSATTDTEIRALFGTPTSIDEDDTENILTYKNGMFVMEFELNKANHLKRWNQFLDIE